MFKIWYLHLMEYSIKNWDWYIIHIIYILLFLDDGKCKVKYIIH